MAKQELTILYIDEDVVVVDKPANVLSIPDRYDATKPNLKNLLAAKFGRVFVVHRLDRETSGVICFARNESAHQHLSQQFEARSVEKHYLGIVEGLPFEKEGVIEMPIAKHPSIQGKMQVNRKGKPATTKYRIIESFDRFALLDLVIETGRTHQIRVHLEAFGYPLVVDALYGKRDAFFVSSIKKKTFHVKKGTSERPLINRTPLHATQLTIIHPNSEEMLTFEANPPKDIRALINQLQKWQKNIAQ